MKDIIIIGGGPAGMTAAIYAARAGKTALVLERENVGGQIIYSPSVENYPGVRQMAGSVFAETLQAQAEALGAEIGYAEVTAVRREGGTFVVETDDGEKEAAAVIIAAGASHRKLGLPGEEELTGCGVSYCAVCDGAFYAGCDVAVNGGGNTALQDALFLSNTCSHVTVIHRRDEFRGDLALVRRLEEKKNVSFLLSSTVTGLAAEADELSGIVVKDLKTGNEKTLPVKGLFIAIGQIPETGPFRGAVSADDAGYIEAGEDCRTGIPGLFAAGDCRTKEVRQLTTAAADGAIAALAACSYIDR